MLVFLDTGAAARRGEKPHQQDASQRYRRPVLPQWFTSEIQGVHSSSHQDQESAGDAALQAWFITLEHHEIGANYFKHAD